MIRARSARLRRVVAARTHAVSCARSCAATANLVATAMPCLHHAITGMASELTRRDTSRRVRRPVRNSLMGGVALLEYPLPATHKPADPTGSGNASRMVPDGRRCGTRSRAAGRTDMRTVLISMAWTTGILVAIIAWRRLVPAPMPRVFDFILRTKFRRRTFSPEIAAERHGVTAGMRVLEVGPAG